MTEPSLEAGSAARSWAVGVRFKHQVTESIGEAACAHAQLPAAALRRSVQSLAAYVTIRSRLARPPAPDERGAEIARLTVFGYTGFIVGPALIGFISQAVSLRAGIATLAVLAVGLAIGGFIVLRGASRSDFGAAEELLNSGRA